MTEQDDTSHLGHSARLADTLRAQLAALLPAAFSEGRLDVAALRRALGEEAPTEGERYTLDWAGKANAYKVLQTPSSATLRPERSQSVQFDSAQHVFIEGENLEVLKVLQKAYFGKIKLIYIDPPYNTGSDSFIYPDRFQESKEDYLRRIDALHDDGTLMREGFFRKNNKENGHYHSNWLSMMLPRLYIARNLLREDGVIFVSIDDNEVHNLRCLMNEVFGEENFVTTIIWQKVYAPKNSARHFSEDHDYILVYARRAETWHPTLLPRTEAMTARYDNPDNDPRGPWKSGDMSARNYYGAGTYAITCPSGRVIENPPPGMYWRVSQEKFRQLDQDKRIWWGKDGNNVPAIKRFLSEVKDGKVPQTLWTYQEVGHTQEAKKELIALVDFPHSDAVFDTPKPTRLIRQMLRLATAPDSDDLVMDFFGGSGTTLQAVLEQNAEDGGQRRCIVVQLPEPIEAATEALASIADIARERVRRAIGKISQSSDLASPPQAGNLAFKSFCLAPSNFKQWRGDDIDTPEQLAEQIALFARNEKTGAAVEDVLHELLLKFGQELTTPIETLDIAGTPVHAIHDQRMLFVLTDFHQEMIIPLVELRPGEIIAIDSVFNNSDRLKTNLHLQCRDAGIRLVCV